MPLLKIVLESQNLGRKICRDVPWYVSMSYLSWLRADIYHLQDGEYIKAENSLVFPNLPIQKLPKLIEQNREKGRRAIRRAVREWVREFRTL